MESWYENVPWSKSGRRVLSKIDNYFLRDHDAYLDFLSKDSARLYFTSGAFVGAVAVFGTTLQRQTTMTGYAVRAAPDTSRLISYAYDKENLTMARHNSLFSIKKTVFTHILHLFLPLDEFL